MIINFFQYPLFILNFFKGFCFLMVLLSPLTLGLTFFLTVMGAGGPKTNPWLAFGMALTFVYGIPSGGLLALLVFAKIFDVIVWQIGWATPTVSILGIALASGVLVVLGNAIVDNWYQFKQGNYCISFGTLLLIWSYALVVYVAAQLPLPFFY
jgi:hypothetical protein